MRRLLVLAAVGTLAALAVATPVEAKGPSTASLTGPGLGHAAPINGDGEMGGPSTPLGALVQFGGYFAQVFTEIPDPTTQTRPKANLGPRYRVVYRVPGPDSGPSTIVQDVYPYAKPTPVTYMPAGQHFWGTQRTHGGWFVSDPRLKTMLVAAGLPKSPPSASGGTSFPWAWTGAGAGALAVLLLLALALRRRGIPRFRMLKNTA
jgi:hypothetical protein